MTDTPLTADEVAEAELMMASPVTQSFSKEQLDGRAKEFMRIHFGNVRSMTTEQKREYHEIAGILMFYTDHLWEPFR